MLYTLVNVSAFLIVAFNMRSRCGIFHLWHHIYVQKLLNFGAFWILDFWIRMLCLYFQLSLNGLVHPSHRV